MSATVDVILTGPLPGATGSRLDERFKVYRPFADQEQADALAKAMSQVRGIATGAMHERIDDTFMARFPKLEIVASFGVGYDHVDAAAASKRG